MGAVLLAGWDQNQQDDMDRPSFRRLVARSEREFNFNLEILVSNSGGMMLY